MLSVVFRRCMNETTAHGLPRVVKSPTVIAKIIWLIFTLCFYTVFLYHSSTLYFQYISQQVSVSVIPNAIPFMQPDILVCLNKPFAIDYLYYPPAYSLESMKQAAKKIQTLDGKLEKVDNRLKKLFKNDSTMFLWNSVNVSELFHAFSYRSNELFIGVFCNGNTIKLTNVEMNWMHLACWRITPSICRLSTPQSTLKFVMYIHSYNLNIIGPEGFNISLGGIPIVMYQFNDPNDNSVTDSIIVYILPRNENIKEDSTKVLTMGGTKTDVGITSTIYNVQNRTESSCVNQCIPYTVHDLLTPGTILTFNDTITCMAVMAQRRFYAEYNCVVVNYPIPIEIPISTPLCLNITGNIEAMINFSTIFLSFVYQKEALDKCMQCIPCTNVKYSTSKNYMNWPLQKVMLVYMDQIMKSLILSDMSRGIMDPGFIELSNDVNGSSISNLNLWRQNLYYIVIRIGEYNSTQISESIPYILKNFLADTGSIMGFYTGASVITLCEIFGMIHYFLRMAFISRTIKKKEKGVEKR